MKRTFIGLKIDSDPFFVSTFIQLKKNIEGNLRWMDPENLHLTLRFLGSAEDTQITEIIEKMSIIIPEYKSFNIDIQGLGYFGSLKYPRILWAGVKIPDHVFLLVSKIDDVACGAGFKAEDRPWSPHLTLCRIKELTDSAPLTNLVEKYKQVHLLKQEVKQIVLYESILQSLGPIYKALHVFQLT